MTKEERALRARDNRDLTQGSITKKIILFALPIMLGNLFQQFYNVVDSWVVGNYAANGTACLAAVNASFPIMMFFNSIYIGISMGATIILSQYKGAKDYKQLEKAMTTTFMLSVWCGVIITVVGLLTSRLILEALGTPEAVLDDATLYLRIIFIGTCGNVIYNGMNGMCRGVGDAKFPMYALIISALLNIALDLLFVKRFHWDVAGVAWATIIAHFVSGILMVWKQNTGVYGAKVDFHNLRMDKVMLKLILKLGLPAAVQNAMFSVGNMITQSFSNRFGVNYLAAHAIIMKADGFAVLPMIGLQMAATSYVGQNIGAGDIKRTNKGIGISCIIGCVIAVIVGALLLLFGKDLMTIVLCVHGAAECHRRRAARRGRLDPLGDRQHRGDAAAHPAGLFPRDPPAERRLPGRGGGRALRNAEAGGGRRRRHGALLRPDTDLGLRHGHRPHRALAVLLLRQLAEQRHHRQGPADAAGGIRNKSTGKGGKPPLLFVSFFAGRST